MIGYPVGEPISALVKGLTPKRHHNHVRKHLKNNNDYDSHQSSTSQISPMAKGLFHQSLKKQSKNRLPEQISST